MSHFCKHVQYLLALLVLGATCLAGRPVYAQYTYTVLDDPDATGNTVSSGTFAAGINDSQQIVGYYTNSTGQHGFVYTAAAGFTTIDVPMAIHGTANDLNGSGALGINNAGQIVGGYTDSVSGHGFAFTPGAAPEYIQFDYPAASGTNPSTFAAGINASGQIVGSYFDDAGQHGYLYTAATGFTSFTNPATTLPTLTTGINDLGQIVGFYTGSGVSHSFLYTPGTNGASGTFTVIQDPASPAHTLVRGINSSGQIAGFILNNTGQHGFFYTPKTGSSSAAFYTLDDPAIAGSVQAQGINSFGQIVGYFRSGTVTHGFLATPLPSPTALTATVSGGAVVLKWQAAAGSVLRYDVYRGTTPGGETLYQSAGTATTFTDSALTQGTPYFYTITAVSSLGTSFPSNEVTATVPVVPAAPTNLQAVAGNAQATLSWTAPTGTVTSYTLHRGTSATSLAVLKTGITATTFTNVLLKNGTTYYYAVAAVNSAGTGAKSSTVSATPTALPPAPTNLQAVTGNQQATLSWTAPTGTVTSYTLYRGTSASSLTVLKTGITATTFTNVLLKHGTTYYYTVKAVNANGTGPASNEVSATP